MTRQFCVLIPANNEASQIGPCLDALLASNPVAGHALRIIVIANGCRDDTAARARAHADRFAARGWALEVLEFDQGGKIFALNAAEALLPAETIRAYLDADIRISPALLSQTAAALAAPAPRFATGTVQITAPPHPVLRRYARFWQSLPYFQTDAPGFGYFAVNAQGRARWGIFPDIIADDTFVRLNFAPSERRQVAATYQWPLVEALIPLIRVRQRQDRGTAEIAHRFPELMDNENKPRLRMARLFRQDPPGFVIYCAILLAARLSRLGGDRGWTRGR